MCVVSIFIFHTVLAKDCIAFPVCVHLFELVQSDPIVLTISTRIDHVKQEEKYTSCCEITPYKTVCDDSVCSVVRLHSIAVPVISSHMTCLPIVS